MGYRVSGILKLPDGTPANNAEIEFISRKNFSPLVQELKSNIKCSATGAYDVTLEYGEYAVIVYPGGTYPAALGTIILAADTVVGQDLPTLLQQAEWQPATPEYIQQIAQWLAEANASASDALASELAAKASENNAKASELAAESDRAEVAAKSESVDTKHSEVVSKAAIVDAKTAQVIAAESVAVAAADTASQKASDAAGHEAVSLDAATRAENAAISMVGAIIDGGECDLSGGVYPQPVSESGVTYSTVWFVAVGGTVGGVAYDAGDQLRYTTASSGYYFKVDAKDDVYSVNGEKGAITVTPEKIGAEASGTASQLITQHESKPSAHAISGVAGLRQELDDIKAVGLSASAAVLDAERRSLERATGGRQTIIYDSAGNANAMFVLPRFSYEDLGMTAAMGSGDVTAFDFGGGSIKSEIFIGAYMASGAGAVSAPRQDPSTSLDHTAARNACSAKGAGWHLMTAHEWAAIALWCMANGYEPIGNTNWGRSHAKTWMVGDRADNRAPGDASGIGRTQTGSMGSEATHTRTLGGIADLVGNAWEWQDGFLLQDGRFKLSAFNAQAEAGWAFTDAYLDASSPTGGSPILSNAITNRLGAIGDNANAGNSANSDWRIMAKAGGYVSNQAMKRLLLEPANALPQGRIYMRNFGERLPFRGGSWAYGADAGLAALFLLFSRVFTATSVGFRPAFA